MDNTENTQQARAYIYIEEINKPNIEFGGQFDIHADLPFVDWLKQMKPIGPPWFRIVWPVALIISTIAIDFVLMDAVICIVRSILWRWLIKEVIWKWLTLGIITECVIKEVFKSFAAKILGLSAFFVFGFFVFWLIKSGKWQDLFDFVSGLFS